VWSGPRCDPPETDQGEPHRAYAACPAARSAKRQTHHTRQPSVYSPVRLGGRSRNVGDKPMRVIRLRLTQHQGRREGGWCASRRDRVPTWTQSGSCGLGAAGDRWSVVGACDIVYHDALSRIHFGDGSRPRAITASWRSTLCPSPFWARRDASSTRASSAPTSHFAIPECHDSTGSAAAPDADLPPRCARIRCRCRRQKPALFIRPQPTRSGWRSAPPGRGS